VVRELPPLEVLIPPPSTWADAGGAEQGQASYQGEHLIAALPMT
jgi:hypothetical protein